MINIRTNTEGNVVRNVAKADRISGNQKSKTQEIKKKSRNRIEGMLIC